MKPVYLLLIALSIISFSCKKQQEEGLLKEAATSPTGLDLPDSLFVGKGIVGKWKLIKIDYPGASPENRPTPEALFGFTNKDSLIVTNDIDKDLSQHLSGLAKGKYPYVYSAMDSASNPNTNHYRGNGRYEYFANISIGKTVWYSHVSDSTLWMYPDVNGPYYSYSKIKRH